MAGVLYEVLVQTVDERTAYEWLRWMRETHLADVVSAGALRGRVVRLDEPAGAFVAQYEFGSRAAFEKYLREHAPRLRAEGLKRFAPPTVRYSRRSGEVVLEEPAGQGVA